MFSLRIVNVDHYMSSPKFGFDVTYSQFRGTQIKSVPVFRIFGSTPSGNKTCLHVHGVFPYILVPYSGEDEAGKLMYQLASSLDKAINVSQNTSLSSRQHVFKIVQVSGRPFYGYHSQDHQFLKIFFYNPLVVKRACDLLQNGAVCGTKFQIHEGHVPFTLQFFIDYNLYGMSFINLKNVVFRKDACPPGVSSGELPKESFCELEADAVAVDIMNRLTIEGELAVNPGLAAIWREEKERLRRDALDVSQRPEAPLALSERLLMDKLCDNIKYQGKCKTPLKENIPYPAETQRTTGSEILDASILDTHSMTSLASKRFSGKAVEAATVIDEELVLSLTQSSVLSSSLDQSLLAALDDLAAHSEAVSAVVSQQVEEDSILGSQMVQELDMFGSDASDGEQEALNFSLPPDLFTDDQPDDENSEDTDENFEESIPQVDGVGEFGGKKRKSKQRVKKRGVLMENSASESYPPSDGEEMLLNNIKDNNCWPETGKQETLEEIFSDEEPFNSPINNFDERCGSVELEPINVDLVHTFEMVLRGDPSLTSGDLASEDVMFQPAEDVNDEEKIAGEEAVLRNTQSDDKRPGVDKNSNINTVVSLNTALDSTEDKSVVLDISSDELLNTSQLDEMFNEDLNKGLEIICEKSPQQEFEDKWSKPEENSQVEALDEDTLNYEMIETSNEVLVSGITKGSESGIVGDIITNGFDLGEDNFEAMPDLNPEDLNEKSFENCTYLGLEENCSQISATSYLGEDEIPNDILGSCKETLTPVIQNVSPITRGSSISKSNLKSQTPLKKSPQKGIKMKISVNLFNQKKTEPLLNNLSEMTRKEIETYYLQLETLSKFLSQRTDMEEAQPMLWFPIRKGQTIQNLGQKRKRKRKPKTSSNEVIMKKCKFSDEEILKMKSCKVMVHKLNYCKVNSLVEKQVNQSNTLDVKKTSHLTNVELSYSDAKSLQNPCKDSVIPSLSKRNFEKASKMSKESIKEERVSESLTICTKTPPKLNKSPRKLPDKIHKKSKHNNVDLKKTFESEEVSLQVLDKLPSVQLTKVENTVTSNIKLTVCEIQDVSNNNLKNKKISSKIHSDKTIQNKPKVKKHRSLSNKNSVKSKREENNDVVCDNVKKFKSKLKDKFKEITNMNIESQTNKDTAPLKDQSTSFKKNKECVIKLLPLVVNEQEKSGLAGAMGSINSEEALNNTHVPNSNAVQESVLPKPVGEEPIIYPLVKAEKLIAPSHLVKDIPETKTEAKSKKQRSIENECRTIKTIYSLDGTVDSSSSDENVEDRSKRKPDEAEQLRTPKKRKKSKSTHSPRSYVPLSIEIKKSPKLLSKNKNPDLVGNVEKLPDERNENTAKDNLKTVSNLVKPDITNCNEKRKLMEPVVALERLQLVTNSDSDNSDSSSKGQPVPSSSHPLVKRLKVFVKRLSSDTSESPLERERVAESVSRTHRSSSLPPTVEDRSVTSLEAGTSHPADRSQQVPSSTSLPQIKRLKVFVKRLSLDTKGCSLEHGRVAELKGRSHRRLSLPTSVE